jgi:uncharacterized membrane protein YebE (DUF533 family)
MCGAVLLGRNSTGGGAFSLHQTWRETVMSMKRILGTMLASRMAGRGMRGGIGRGGIGSGGLGGLAAAGLLGGRRGGLGRKAGLAALGYMAYRAYQDHTARSGGSTSGSTSGSSSGFATGSGTQPSAASGGSAGHAASGGGLSGALGDIVRSVSDALTGQQGSRDDRTPAPASTGAGASADPGASADAGFSPEDEQAAESFSEDTALLLVRAMVTAANADGTISADERARILAQADEAGADAEDRQALERELANPRSLDELLTQVRDRETAEEFYLASRMAVDETTEANRAYLVLLRERLGLGEQDAAEIDSLVT